MGSGDFRWTGATAGQSFNRTAEGDSAMLTAGKRLGSLPYWRYYFAFSAPQNVLEPKIFEELFALARQPEQQQALAKQLLGYIQSKNLSTRTGLNIFWPR